MAWGTWQLQDMIKESLRADEKIKVLTFAVTFFFSHTTRIQVFGRLFFCFYFIALSSESFRIQLVLGRGLDWRETTDFDVNVLVAVTKMIKMLGDGMKIESFLYRLKWWAHTPDGVGEFTESLHSCRKQMWLSNSVEDDFCKGHELVKWLLSLAQGCISVLFTTIIF